MGKEIDLIKKQIAALDDEDFDLKAWKAYTTVLLERIFGPQSRKIKEIESIHYDFGSWTLRDTAGNRAETEGCKEQGRKILEAAIYELKSFGVPESNNLSKQGIFSIVQKAMEEELKISQYHEIIAIIKSDEKFEGKKDNIVKKFSAYRQELAERIFANIILNEEISRQF